ncbi:hypothetical protein ACFY5C_12440 [Streptomyces sp. NPDC012935]|uniref:hypothetical protein n=1 Tax=Streptomyces sp. NPDC012935 TaxID=3364857 RepID=UPI0036CB1503
MTGLKGAERHARIECGGRVSGAGPAAKLRLTLLQSEVCLAGFGVTPRAARTRPHFETSLTAPAPVIVWTRRGCDPDCLRRALKHDRRRASAGVLITSTAAEATAAQRIGLPVIGYALSPAAGRRLRKAGCDVIVDSLRPILDAARSL